jgi:hypothetical protein
MAPSVMARAIMARMARARGVVIKPHFIVLTLSMEGSEVPLTHSRIVRLQDSVFMSDLLHVSESLCRTTKYMLLV